MQKSLLIFDLDGTLLDSVPDLANAVNFALKTHHLAEHSVDTIRNFVGNGTYVLCQRAAGGDEALTQKVYQDFLHYYAEHTCDVSTPYAHVMTALPQLKQHGFTLAIATNKPQAFLPSILQKFGWDKLFALTVGGDSLPAKKPDPLPLQYLCQQLQTDPACAVMIGDSKNDILAGKNAGITTLGLRYGYNYGEAIDSSHPDQAFDNFLALTDYLLKLR